MTAIAMPQRRRNSLALSILAWALAFSVMYLAISHADLKHGSDAQTERDCVKRHGVWQVWREPSGAFHLLCQTPDGQIFDWIRNPDGSEKTAFRPNPKYQGNIWNDIREWLERKGATKFTGGLPFTP